MQDIPYKKLKSTIISIIYIHGGHKKMLTAKLYYDDVFLTECSAKVLGIETRQDGAFDVCLDRTIMYPEGGGQLCDTGTIDGKEVTFVREKNGSIIHTVAQKPEHEEVVVKLNLKRRFDHMQQHTGQHILSGAFYRLYGIDTISFHMGEEVSYIDIDTEKLTDKDIMNVEYTANQVVFSNVQVNCSFKTKEEISEISMRKSVIKDISDIRIVEIDELDVCPCGGTHTDWTGSVGIIKVIGTERKNKAIRVYFLCGNRALAVFQNYQETMHSLSNKFMCSYDNILETVDRYIEKADAQQKQLNETTTILNSCIARELWQNANEFSGCKIITAKRKVQSAQDLSDIAKALGQYEKTILLLAGLLPEGKAHLVFTRSADINIKMNDILKKVLPVVDGKGGGSQQTAQGGCKYTDKLDDALFLATEHVRIFLAE